MKVLEQCKIWEENLFLTGDLNFREYDRVLSMD